MFKEACSRGCQIGVSLLKSGYLSAAGLSNVKMVADRHRLLNITSTGDGLLRIVNIDDLD